MALLESLQYVGAFVVALGIIVFVHEFGHFAVAKLFGMRVFIFSFGFGRRLAGFKWGDTDCRLSLVPLGGYVKLDGEPDDHLSEAGPTQTRALSDGTLVEVENPNYFTNRPRWQRILVYLAGPFMNAVLTIAVFTVFHMVGFYVEATDKDGVVVGAVEAGSPAEQAGVRPGDQLVSIDGKAVENWNNAQYAILIRPDANVRLEVLRGGARQVLEARIASKLDAEMKMKLGHLGVSPLTRLGRVRPDSPAQAAGLRPGDGVLTINGQPVLSFRDLADKVGASQGRTLDLAVLRDGAVTALQVTPQVMDGAPRIGVEPYQVRKQYGFLGAVGASTALTWTMTRQTFDTLGRLVTFRLSPKSLSGPLGIAKVSGDAAREGADRWFFVVAFISLQVGILNLMPIAPLDGGHLAILALESVRRRDLSERAKAYIMNAGVGVLLLLIVVVFYSDLSKTQLLGRYLP